MISFLRFFGVTVAAVWFGATVFFTFFAGPAFFTDEMKRLFPPPYNGAIAEFVIARLFILHYICGCLALLHLGAEWLYLGKEPPRLSAWVVGGALALSLIGGIWLQPKLKEWQRIKYEQYGLTKTAAERAEAAKSFGMWHGISMGMNLLTLAALWLNLARVILPGEAPRFVSPVNKFGIDRRS